MWQVAICLVFRYYVVMVKSVIKPQPIDTAQRIFNALDVGAQGYLLKQHLLQALLDRGVLPEDSRIRQTKEELKKIKDKDKINPALFRKLITPHITLIEKALTGGLVIPDFKNFTSFIANLYNRTMQNQEGSVSNYLPELAGVSPDNYALSVCTVDGQRFNVGSYNIPYVARETAKAINYCLAFEESDETSIHEKVGRAPKEKGFDYLMLDQKGLPHNPFTGSGAIMIGSLLASKSNNSARLNKVKKLWNEMSGGTTHGWSEKAFNSEKRIADADRALGYFMQQKRLFTKGSDVNKHLEFLWSCYAIETTTEAQAVIAATLANAGVCPTTEREVLKPLVAKHCLSVMSIAGVGDYSSEYAYAVGLPAISGSSGGVMIVVPDVMGIAIWSPRIDEIGNSIKGVDFSHKFVERFNFHAFDSAIKNIGKIDPRLKKT